MQKGHGALHFPQISDNFDFFMLSTTTTMEDESKQQQTAKVFSVCLVDTFNNSKDYFTAHWRFWFRSSLTSSFFFFNKTAVNRLILAFDDVNSLVSLGKKILSRRFFIACPISRSIYWKNEFCRPFPHFLSHSHFFPPHHHRRHLLAQWLLISINTRGEREESQQK